jgi:hypothetical protein
VKFKPGDRVVIARGPGAGLAGVVCAPRPNDPAGDALVCVQFDADPGARYWAPAAGLSPEAMPKKPRRPSVRRERKQKKRK